jgi:hypothetical protein
MCGTELYNVIEKILQKNWFFLNFWYIYILHPKRVDIPKKSFTKKFDCLRK